MPNIITFLTNELNWEAQKTQKTLSRIPNNKFDWSPHEKNRPMSRLSGHIAELPAWIPYVLQHDELNFQNPPTFLGHEFHNQETLMPFFEQTQKEAQSVLKKAEEAEFDKPWAIRNGATILTEGTKGEILRRMCFNHIVHHRAQLGVYLRLLDIPIPATYGPSADEQGF